MKGKGPNLRTWGFIAGGSALLALLTLVLCLLGGVFNFAPKAKPEAAATPELSTPKLELSPTPMQTMDPLDTPRPTQAQTETWWNISVIGGVGGTVSPAGLVQVVDGESVTLSVAPDEGYAVGEMKVDGQTVDAASSYTFSNVTQNHSFYVVFRPVPKETEPPAETPVPASATDIA